VARLRRRGILCDDFIYIVLWQKNFVNCPAFGKFTANDIVATSLAYSGHGSVFTPQYTLCPIKKEDL